MKKMYIQPNSEAVVLAQEDSILAISGQNGQIGYGGVDEDGSKDPAAKGDIFDENPFK